MTKTKKILGIVLALIVLTLAMSISIFAQDTENVVLPDGVTAADFGDNTVTDGTNFYATIKSALEGIHLTDNRVLYCKPGADVGVMTHGHVCANLIVYGNGASLTASGEQDFELDTYKFCHNGAKTCDGITDDLTLTVKNLNGCGAWGQRATSNTVNIVFENCKDMNRIYISGTSGINNITLINCSFLGSIENRCTLYSNANGTVTVSGCVFENIYAPINLNHKIAGTQTIVIENTAFDACGTAEYDYAAPVRVLSSVEGAESALTVSGCTFANTVANKNGQDADILIDYGVGTTNASVSSTAAKVTVEVENNVSTDTTVSVGESKGFANVEQTGLKGTGTEADPFLIEDLDDLKWFRDDVNAGNSYAGQFVKLTDDIDLNQDDWTPIKKFNGTFDGNGKTISNLWVTGSGAIGFFAQVADQTEHASGTVKNITFNNATIISSNDVAGLIADARLGARINNVKLTGEIQIQGYRGVGGIVGAGFPVMDGCSVEAEGTITATYWGVGGILGFANDAGAKVSNSTIKSVGAGLTIHGELGGVGAVTGTPYGASTNGATVSGVELTSNNNYYMGYIDASGTVNGNVTVSDTVVKVNGKEIVGRDAVASIGTKAYFSLQAAIDAVKEGETIVILGKISEGAIKLPAGLKNVTFKGAEGASLKDMTVMSPDGGAYALTNITFDGIVFDNSILLLTGNRNTDCAVSNLTITNCTFKNIVKTGNYAAVHFNFKVTEPVYGFTFTNNTVDGVTGSSNCGITGNCVSGDIVIQNNTFNNVALYPFNMQIVTSDGVKDTFTVTGNTFSGSANGRLQALSKSTIGTDAVEIVTTNNIIKGITSNFQICYYNLNSETTTVDLSKNYYDIDILANPGKIYFNGSAQNVSDLIDYGVFPYYADEAMTEEVTAPAIMVTYPVGNPVYPEGKVEFYDNILEAVPYTTNCPRLEGATITLLKDVSGAGLRFMENDMVFDLNGHTFTITAGTGSQGTNTSGFQIRPEVTTKVTFKNGTIDVAEGAPVVWMFNCYATDFIVENVTVDCANMAWGYGASCYVVVSRSGDNVQFTGNTKIENFNAEVAGNAINVGGTMTAGENVVLGGVVELDAGATFKAPAGLTVVTVDGYKVDYADGEYKSVKLSYVAQIGDQKYATFEDAVKAIPTDGTDVVIKILTDIELTNSIEFNYGTGKITFTADAPVVIKQTKVGLDLAFTIGKAATIVVDENVTFEIYDNASGMYLYYGPSLVINGSISGGQNWGCLYLFNGTHLVSTTGSINVGRLQIAYTELTVLGEIDTNYLLVEGADFIANGAIIEVGAIHDSNNGGTRWGASDFSFLNGTVVNANTITLKYADSVINLDLSSSITANKIEGIGKIVIDVSGFNGTATQVIKADMSKFTGTVELVNGDGKQSYEITDSGLSIISAVAQIGDKTFATLQAAIDAVKEGETIVLLGNVTVTTPAYGQNALNYAKAVNCTIDLGGYTLTADTGNSVLRFNIAGSGATSNVTVTLKNGKVVAGSNTWCAVMASGISADVKAIFNLEDLTIESSKAGDLAVKAWANAVINAKNVTVNATNGAGGFYALGGEIVLDNCTVNQKGLHTAPYLSMAIAVSNNGKLTVNSGSYTSEPTAAAEGYNQGTSHGSWCAGVMNSGGTLIINGGTFANGNYGDDSLATAARGLILADTASVVQINGGTFNALKSIIDYQNNLGVQPNPNVVIAGGTFSADPTVVTSYGGVIMADGCVAIKDLNGNYVVGVAPTATVNDYGPTIIPGGEYGVWDGSNYTSTSTADMPLSFVMQFIADQTAADMANSPYADWYADFVITFDGLENDAFIANGCYLAGYYGDFGWVKIPVDGMTIEEGVRYPVMLGVGLGQKYDYVCSGVKDFKCALYITPEILALNPNLTVNLELAVVDNSKGQSAAAEAMVNGTVYSVTDYDYVAEDFQITVATVGEKKFTTLQAAIDYAIANGGKVTLVSSININEGIVINGNVEIDLAGYKVALDSNVANCVFNIENGTVAIANGTIYTNNGQAIYAGLDKDTSYAPVVALENVTLEGADFGLSVFGGANVTIGNGVVINGSVEALRVWNSAQVTVNAGASITCTGNGEVARVVAVYESASVSVTGGTFTGIVDKIAGTIAITGGTFTFDVSAYVAEGYAAIQNLDGKYVVGVEPTATVKDYGPTIIAGGDYGIWDGKNYTSTSTADMPLSFVMQFIADQTAADMANSPYADWYADFVITFDGLENDAFIANGCYLAGYYGDFGWVKIPVDGMTIEEGVRYPVMLGVGLGQKYDYVCSGVKDFKCALYITPEILALNPNLTVNLELAVVDNSKGQSAAAEAMVNGTSYNVTDYDYVAEDFIVDYVAAVGNKQFTSLADAIAYANENGGTVTLLDNIALSETIMVTGTVTLDLNGYTITGTDNSTGSFGLFTNKGTFTITGNGAITLVATNNRAWNNYSSVISNQVGGKLIVEGGTIEHLGGTDMAYGIDNLTNGKGTYAETVINGGTIKSTYRAIRQFLNGVEAQNILTVNGGTIEGANKSIWLQDPSKNANTGTLTVGANAVIKGDIYLFVTAGSTEWPVEVSIAASAIVSGEVLTGNVPEGYAVQESNGIIGVVEVTYVAEVNGVKYESLQDAINAANGGTVTLLDNIELDAPIVVTGTVILDLAGYTIKYNSTVQGEAMITNRGNLTINDSVGTGVINYNYTGAADSSYSKGNYTISNAGTLTVNGGKITIANLSGHAKYPIDNNSTTGNAVLVINGGHLYNYNTSAIRQFCNSTTYKNSVTINGGLIEGYSAIWVQNPGSKTVNGDLTVNGGEIKSTAKAYVNGTAELKDVSSKIYFTIAGNGGAWSEGSFVALNGGTFNENVNLASNAPYTYTIGEDAVFNGRLQLPAVASVNGIDFATLAEAIAYANENGGTVTLLDNIALSETIMVTGTVTLDLNGYTITGTDNSTGSFGLFTNKGTFTITGNGAITLVATNNRAWNNYSSVISNQVGGKLIVEGGTIEHLGGTDMAYGIDNLTNGKGTYAETVINGGTIKSTYRAIRQFLNGIEAQNILTVNGGTIEGANKAIFFQDPSANANTGSLTIGENAVVTGGVYLFVTAGSTEWPVEVSIATSALANGANDVTSKNVPEGYFIKEANGVIGVEKIEKFGAGWSNINLGTDLSIEFMYSASNFDGTDYYAVVKKCHADNCKCKAETYYIAWNDEDNFITDSTGWVHVKVNGIAAAEMVCDIEITIFKGSFEKAEDGTITENGYAVSKTNTDSIVKFVERAIPYYASMNIAKKEQLFTLMADMLVYGAEAQRYFEHYVDVDGGIVTEYSDTIKDFVDQYSTQYDDEGNYVVPDMEYAMTREEADGARYFWGANIDLEHTIFFNLYFENIDTTKDFDAQIKFTHHNSEVHTYSIKNGDLNWNLLNGGQYLQINIDDLQPSDLRLDVECIITVDGEQVSKVILSVEDFIATSKQNGATADIYNAVLRYADSAEAYFYQK